MTTTEPGADVRADMAEQPGIVARLLARRAEIAAELAGRGLLPNRGIILVARGSSDHAAIYARYLLELAAELPVVLAAPSLYTRYRSRIRVEGWTVVAISQSGATPEIATTVDALRSGGARAIAVTNDATSPLAERADLVIALECGPERAIPATKTFTASLAALVALGRAIAPSAWTDADEEGAVESLADLLAGEPPPEALAGKLLGAEIVTHLGRAFTFPVALEGALKHREMTGRVAEGMSATDYLHGPVAAAGARTRVVAYVDGGPAGADVRVAADAARARGARVLVVTDDAERARDDEVLLVPRQPKEALAIFAFVIRAQQLALACASHAGVDPDRPPGLHKVTATS